jgi:hypothetical protein
MYSTQKSTLNVEVKQEQGQFYAVLYQGDVSLCRSDYFNTAAGASVAGYLLLSEQQPKTPGYFSQASRSAAI